MNKYRDTVAKAKAETSGVPVGEVTGQTEPNAHPAQHVAEQQPAAPKAPTNPRPKQPDTQKPPIEMTSSSIAHILTTPTVPMTTRYEPEIAEALKRAALEQRARRQHPNTLQAIQNEAARMWLQAHAYLSHKRVGNE